MRIDTTPKLMEAARMAINNTLEDSELQKKMSNYGFPQKRVLEGKSLLEQLQILLDTQEQHYDERSDLSTQLKTDLQSSREIFTDHVKVAKIAFRNFPDTLRKLKIQRVDRSTWDWTLQAMTFYKKVTEHAEQMNKYDVSKEELEQAKVSVEALLVLKDRLMKKKGTAEGSTRRKNESVKTLRDWVREFHAASKLAMKDNPQLLEAYGLVVKAS